MKIHVITLSEWSFRSFLSAVMRVRSVNDNKGESDLVIVLNVFEGKPELQILLFLVWYPCGAKNSENKSIIY